MTKDWVGIAEARLDALHVKNAEIGRLRAELYDTTCELGQCREKLKHWKGNHDDQVRRKQAAHQKLAEFQEKLAAAKETLSEGYGTSCQECWQDVLERPGGIRFATVFLCNEHYDAALEQARADALLRLAKKLTPCGPDFGGDSEACQVWIEERMSHHVDCIKSVAGARQIFQFIEREVIGDGASLLSREQEALRLIKEWRKHGQT